MAKRNFIIYGDESDKSGKFFGNFFGGVLLKAEDRQQIDELLNEKKLELNLGNELKWQRVSQQYLEKYMEFIEYYFTFVSSGRLRTRIMFTQNIHVPVGLTPEQRDAQYFLIYYQFIKHAFGIKYGNPNAIDRMSFALLLDQIPDTKEKTDRFKRYLAGIPNQHDMQGLNISVPYSDIAEIDSQDHVILQGLDIILGAMCFRLNDKHREKPEGKHRRGKRTIAKEKLYKAINKEICKIYPRFNIGGSTGTSNGYQDRWSHPYRHWKFVPVKHAVDLEKGKKRAP